MRQGLACLKVLPRWRTTVGNSAIPNTGQLWTNNPNLDNIVRPPLPSNEVKTNWGSLLVLKRAAQPAPTVFSPSLACTFQAANNPSSKPPSAATCSLKSPHPGATSSP